MEVKSEIVEDCELSVILSAIQISPSGTVPAKAIDFLNKLAYFDLSDGIEKELCISIISKWCGQNDRHVALMQEREAEEVLQILHDNNAISELRKSKNPDDKYIKMQSSLQEKILAQNESDFSFIIDLANILTTIWQDMCGAFMFKSQMFHIHKRLQLKRWPGDTIKLSMCLAASSLHFNFTQYILDDSLKEFVKSSKIDWITCQMIQIHQDTISKSRKVLQPSDTICIDGDGGIQEIRLDNYGSWMLNQIRIYSDSGADCDALISVAVVSLERLQKHARVSFLCIIKLQNGRLFMKFLCSVLQQARRVNPELDHNIQRKRMVQLQSFCSTSMLPINRRMVAKIVPRLHSETGKTCRVLRTV